VQAYPATSNGIVLQLRWEPKGVLEVPGLENTLVALHIGTAAKMACRRGGTRYRGTAVHGDVDIIPANTPARWETYDENDSSLILSMPQLLMHTVIEGCALEAARVEIRNRFQIRDAELEALCWAMKREMESGCLSGRLYLEGLSLAVASRVVLRHSSVANRAEQRAQGLSGPRLKRVLSLIEDQLSEDLSMEQIAAVAGMSLSHMAKLFRSSMGTSVHQYVIKRRVERAKTLLMQDELPVTAIALAAGFAHPSHMARHMRRVLGMSPQAVKRLLANSSS
jgi:AraC family transcriptional regulator